MKKYYDPSIFANPLTEYLKWIIMKIYLQTKYWGSHLRIGYNTYIRSTLFGKYNYIGRNVYLENCKIGDFTYISNDSTITGTEIGKFCSIGPNVKFAPGQHPTGKFVSTHPSTFSNPTFLKRNFVTQSMFTGNTKVEIGNDVWIGANCIILDGVVIKDGAVIAANSVVTKNVDEYCIFGGSPAKFLKKRFEDDEIEKLIAMKWWDRSEQWIEEHIVSFWDIKLFTEIS